MPFRVRKCKNDGHARPFLFVGMADSKGCQIPQITWNGKYFFNFPVEAAKLLKFMCTTNSMDWELHRKFFE